VTGIDLYHTLVHLKAPDDDTHRQRTEALALANAEARSNALKTLYGGKKLVRAHMPTGRTFTEVVRSPPWATVCCSPCR
jgi:hypothetical protein